MFLSLAAVSLLATDLETIARNLLLISEPNVAATMPHTYRFTSMQTKRIVDALAKSVRDELAAFEANEAPIDEAPLFELEIIHKTAHVMELREAEYLRDCEYDERNHAIAA